MNREGEDFKVRAKALADRLRDLFPDPGGPIDEQLAKNGMEGDYIKEHFSGKRWEDIKDRQLSWTTSEWMWFTKRGLSYFLPAYLLSSLERRSKDYVDFGSLEYMISSTFPGYSQEQRELIVDIIAFEVNGWNSPVKEEESQVQREQILDILEKRQAHQAKTEFNEVGRKLAGRATHLFPDPGWPHDVSPTKADAPIDRKVKRLLYGKHWQQMTEDELVWIGWGISARNLLTDEATVYFFPAFLVRSLVRLTHRSIEVSLHLGEMAITAFDHYNQPQREFVAKAMTHLGREQWEFVFPSQMLKLLEIKLAAESMIEAVGGG